jgi:putative iron-dependent peroxidase
MNADTSLKHHEDDIQAIAATGFARLRWSRFFLLQVTEGARARRWIKARVAGGLIRSVASLGWDAKSPGAAAGHAADDAGLGARPAHMPAGPEVYRENRHDALALAFTFNGIRKLGFEEAANMPFPATFKRGMGDRARAGLFGDTPAAWSWLDHADTRDQGTQAEIHLLAMYFSTRDVIPAFLEEDALEECGLRLAGVIKGCPSYIEDNGAAYEPFGFRDGIAQPVIRGLRESTSIKAARKSAGALFEDRVVAPGEFLLGHLNEYGERASCPDVRGRPRDLPAFGFNGSYLVARQITQHVAAFGEWEAREKSAYRSAQTGAGYRTEHEDHPSSPAEKLIGRRRDGQSLVCPWKGKADPAVDLDAFRYRVEDAVGFMCPRGAHVRRANPRDLLGWDVESGVAAAKLHRLIRRGRVIAQSRCREDGAAACGDPLFRGFGADKPPCGTGLMFIALNADLERQYEFVQQNWIVNRKFGDLADERDPIVGGSGDGAPRVFSVPDNPVGRKLSLTADFTRVEGGGYFFLPSLAALRMLGEEPAWQPQDTQPAP